MKHTRSYLPESRCSQGVVPYPVLRRGQGKSRKVRKEWANADASTQAGQPQHHRSRKGRARYSIFGERELKAVEGKEEDPLDGKNTLKVTFDLVHEREAGDKAAEVTAPMDKPAHSCRSVNTDALYSSQARQGKVIGRHHVTFPMKRKGRTLMNCETAFAMKLVGTGKE